MKRSALLAITGYSARKFEVNSNRGLLPFHIDPDKGWSNYSLDDAIRLAIFNCASDATSLENAAMLARGALESVHPIHPLYFTDNQPLFAALVHCSFASVDDQPEWWGDDLARQVVGGRWQDIPKRIADLRKEYGNKLQVNVTTIVDLSEIGKRVYEAAKDLGLPEGTMPEVPVILKDFPEWFIHMAVAANLLAYVKSDPE